VFAAASLSTIPLTLTPALSVVLAPASGAGVWCVCTGADPRRPPSTQATLQAQGLPRPGARVGAGSSESHRIRVSGAQQGTQQQESLLPGTVQLVESRNLPECSNSFGHGRFLAYRLRSVYSTRPCWCKRLCGYVAVPRLRRHPVSTPFTMPGQRNRQHDNQPPKQAHRQSALLKPQDVGRVVIFALCCNQSQVPCGGWVCAGPVLLQAAGQQLHTAAWRGQRSTGQLLEQGGSDSAASHPALKAV